jgi:hypothetical protein
MSVIGLILLQGAALAGLVMGRRGVLPALFAAVPVTVVFAGVEAGALALLAAAGFALGVHLHSLIAEQYASD